MTRSATNSHFSFCRPSNPLKVSARLGSGAANELLVGLSHSLALLTLRAKLTLLLCIVFVK